MNRLIPYTDAVFAFCLKRLNSVEDARELSQDILFEALSGIKRGQIINFEPWLWRVAHNRYASFLQGKKSRAAVCFEDMLLTSEDKLTLEEEEETAAVFNALHSIARLHREILVEFYVHGHTCLEIAKKHNLPESTVKTRLHYGREKLRKAWTEKMDNKRVYDRLSWFICGNGDVDPHKYLTRQVQRSIVYACYQKALTVEEICDKTGIPCMYIEDELTELLEGEILVGQGNTFCANIIIHSRQATKKIRDILLSITPSLSKCTAELLETNQESLNKINGKPPQKLWWLLIPIILRRACEMAREVHEKSARGVFPLRKDGGKGWIFANEEESPPYFSGCNGYYKENSAFTYYWSSQYFSEEISSYLLRLEDNPCTESLDELTLAQGIRLGLIKKTDEGWDFAITVFTREQKTKLDSLTAEMAEPLKAIISKAVGEIYELIKSQTPPRLHSQIGGVFGAQLNTVIDMVCHELVKSGKLETVNTQYFTEQIMLVK